MLHEHGVPNLIYAENFKEGEIHSSNQVSIDGGKTWCLARGMGFQGLCFTRRLELAWGVFTGKYDALRWGANQ
jgi:hypothetical protein